MSISDSLSSFTLMNMNQFMFTLDVRAENTRQSLSFRMEESSMSFILRSKAEGH